MADRGPGALDQAGTAGARCRGGAVPERRLPAGFMVAGAQPGPGGEPGVGGEELGDADADLADHARGGELADPGHGGQQVPLGLERALIIASSCASSLAIIASR